MNESLQYLSEISHRAYHTGLVRGQGGNVSIYDGVHMYISASGICLGDLAPDRFACMDLNGRVLNDMTPSKEAAMHLECYRQRPDIRGIFHLHPLYSVAVTCRREVDASCVMPVYTPGYGARVGRLPLIPYYRPGSKALAEAVGKVIQGRNSVLLGNHGVVTVGVTPDAALGLAEEIEENAHLTMSLGENGMPMTSGQIKEISGDGTKNEG